MQPRTGPKAQKILQCFFLQDTNPCSAGSGRVTPFFFHADDQLKTTPFPSTSLSLRSSSSATNGHFTAKQTPPTTAAPQVPARLHHLQKTPGQVRRTASRVPQLREPGTGLCLRGPGTHRLAPARPKPPQHNRHPPVPPLHLQRLENNRRQRHLQQTDLEVRGPAHGV